MKTPKNWSDLAKVLDMSRQALSAHRRKPGAPALADVDGWHEYLAAYGRAGTADQETRRKLAEQRLRILEETEERLKRENRKAAGELMLRSEAVSDAACAEAYYFGELDRAERELPPVLAGLDAMAISLKLRAYFEDLRKQSREYFGKFKPA